MPLASVVVSHPWRKRSRQKYTTTTCMAKPIFANSTPVTLPAALGGLVNSVHGLDNFTLKPRIRRPKFTAGNGGAHYLTPGDLGVIYNINPLYTAGLTGKGITIAVVGQTDIVPADITDFRAAAGLPVNNPTVFTVPGTTPESVTNGAAAGGSV